MSVAEVCVGLEVLHTNGHDISIRLLMLCDAWVASVANHKATLP